MFEIFPTFLSTASTAAAKKGGKIILILDAVNQVGFGFGFGHYLFCFCTHPSLS